MLLPDGTRYPEDYTPVVTRGGVGGGQYLSPTTGDLRSMTTLEVHGCAPRLVVPYDDHPVTRAWEVVQRTADLSRAEHRDAVLAFVVLASPADDHGALSTSAPRITTAIQELNRRAELEALLAQVDVISVRLNALERELSDTARAQGDAASRAAPGVLTQDVQR
jgi:hypothetical protein